MYSYHSLPECKILKFDEMAEISEHIEIASSEAQLHFVKAIRRICQICSHGMPLCMDLQPPVLFCATYKGVTSSLKFCIFDKSG
jgi:hypothetical protein